MLRPRFIRAYVFPVLCNTNTYEGCRMPCKLVCINAYLARTSDDSADVQQ